MKSGKPVTFKGETKTLVEWAKDYKLPPQTLYNRLHQGLGLEEALSKPYSPGVRGRRAERKIVTKPIARDVEPAVAMSVTFPQGNISLAVTKSGITLRKKDTDHTISWFVLDKLVESGLI